jgi:hypothetical protein
MLPNEPIVFLDIDNGMRLEAPASYWIAALLVSLDDETRKKVCENLKKMTDNRLMVPKSTKVLLPDGTEMNLFKGATPINKGD